MANAYNQRRRVVVNPQDFGFLSRPSFFLSSSSFLVRMDVHRSFSLMRFMAEAGLLPSPEEELKRELVIQKLKKIVQKWITKVAWQRKLPENVIRDASATILTYGSYGLGEDFFIVLCNILKGRPEVSDIHCVNDAKVPLMRFKFEGVAVDFPYAQFQVMSVPENFQSLLRCIKFWAKRRGVYGNEILSPDSNWDNLFEPYGNAYRKSRFLKIYLVACAIDERGRLGWMGEVTISLSHFEDK